jgi:hydroxypyruvate isomerase
MPRFSANISMLFTEHDFLDRFQAAADAGFEAVELQFPYAFSPKAIGEARAKARIKVAMFNLPAGNLEEGERGIACLPEREAEFRKGVAWGAEYAEALDCGQVNALAGLLPKGADRKDAMYSLANSLAYAAKAMGEHGVRVTLEPINDKAAPTYIVHRTHEAMKAVDAAAHPNLYLQADLFHMATMGEDIVPALKKVGAKLGHVQFADHPGRHEPGTGKIDFKTIFAALDASGYDGWVGAEYVPKGKTKDGLGWLEEFG